MFDIRRVWKRQHEAIPSLAANAPSFSSLLTGSRADAE